MTRCFSSRSIRAYSRPAAREEIDLVLRAARRAPTAAMMHGYCILNITAPDLRQRLDEIGNRQRALHNSSLLLFCADLRRARQWGEALATPVTYTGYTGLLFAAVDCTLAAANAIQAAESLGLGCCIIGTFFHRAADVCETLGLPPGVLPLFGLTMGLPAESPPLRPRLPLDNLVHENTYRDPSPGQLAEAWASFTTWSGTPVEAQRSPEEVADLVRHLVAGSWWATGEEQLRKALERQELLPET